MGIYCEGFEDQFKALLVAIEAGRILAMKSAMKRNRELKPLRILLTMTRRIGMLGRKIQKGWGLSLFIKPKIIY